MTEDQSRKIAGMIFVTDDDLAKFKEEYRAQQKQEQKEKDAVFFVFLALVFWCLITALFPIVGFIILGIGLIILVVFLVNFSNRIKQANTEAESE